MPRSGTSILEGLGLVGPGPHVFYRGPRKRSSDALAPVIPAAARPNLLAGDPPGRALEDPALLIAQPARTVDGAPDPEDLADDASLDASTIRLLGSVSLRHWRPWRTACTAASMSPSGSDFSM